MEVLPSLDVHPCARSAPQGDLQVIAGAPKPPRVDEVDQLRLTFLDGTLQQVWVLVSYR
jgi:hypothetical protein